MICTILRNSVLITILVASGVASAEANVLAHIGVMQTGPEFAYTVFNDEAITSSLYIGAFFLTVDAPFSVSITPAGWDFATDNSTFVDWFNTDLVLPYPNDIAPGSSLGGFGILASVDTAELLPVSLSSWDHELDDGGMSFEDFVLSPVAAAAVPEPGSAVLLGALALSVEGGWLRRQRKRQV